MTLFPRTPKVEFQNCPSLDSRTLSIIISCPEFESGRGLNQSCSSPRDFSNGVLHFTCKHRNWVDSRFLVVGSQIASLTPGPSFDHNLCCRCPNASCEAILDIYTSRPFQRYKEFHNARCFDPYNCALSFWETRRTPKSHFRECEWRPHTSLKVGLQHQESNYQFDFRPLKIMNRPNLVMCRWHATYH